MRKDKQNKELTEDMLLAEYEAVYRYAMAICHSETEAQDLTQETFYKAIKSSVGFKGNSSLYTWLCTIAKNMWINKCKKMGREISEDTIFQDITSKEKSVEQMITDLDTSRRIHKILHTLEEPYKEVFSLRVFGELPFFDIAALFSKSEGWARVTYHRAKKIIIEKLKKDGCI